jgi:hypothetical protein
MNDHERIIDQIVKRHGETINVREQPQVLMDILRRFGPVVVEDGGLPPGGVPPTPSPPGPSSSPFGDEPGTPDGGGGGGGPRSAGFDGPTLNDVMKELLTLSRAVEELRQQRRV